MKHLLLSFTIAFSLLQTACKMVYFDQPQPIDGKTLNSFPKKFRGVWKNELSTITTNKYSMVQVDFKEIKIPLSTFDTSSRYVKNDRFIYSFEEGHLEYKGNYQLIDDTIIVKRPSEMEEHGLNSSIVLKKVGKYYLLNILEENGMWQMIHVENLNNNDLLLKLINNDKLLELIEKEQLLEINLPNINKTQENSKDYYYSGNLQKADIIALIEADAFSDTLMTFSNDNGWLTPDFSRN